jgi:two-component system sensor histidine kinase SenX3
MATFVLGLALGTAITVVAAWRWSRRSAQHALSARRRATVAEGRLATAEGRARRMEGTLDLVGEGIVICDPAGKRVFTNAAAGLLTDARHEDALVAAAVEASLREALDGRTVEREVELFGPPARQVSVAGSPLGPSHARVGAVVLVRDESRLRRLEAVRQEFVANVSHELKTPIGAIALLAETLSGAEDGPEADHRVARLQEEALRLGRIIDDLLELSDVEGSPPNRESVDLAALVEECASSLRPLAEQFGVAIELEVVGDQSCLGDAGQLRSAVGNLIENAVKYADGHSPVTVSLLPGDEWTDLVVRDRGIGIPQQDLERVFERFYRVDKARTRATGGTGLGLAIVRNVARTHGGEVHVASREGEGSTFTLRLPLESLPASEKEARSG